MFNKNKRRNMFLKSEPDEGLILLCGLGNPGKEYENTRHNMGFMAVDTLAQHYKGNWQKTKFMALTSQVTIKGRKVLLVKPQTFMNSSGDAISMLQNYYKVPSQNIMVIYDDIDIDLGHIRIRKKGGAGSHNGMKSVKKSLGTEDFPRIRLGIGPQPEYIDIIDYVLGRLSLAEEEMLKPVWPKVASIVETYLTEGLEIAMTRFNA